jgi:solute carrier family 6 amino acid transporter-like protein 5/7/9/14
LKKSDSINVSGTIVWELALATFVSWLLIFTLLVLGPKVILCFFEFVKINIYFDLKKNKFCKVSNRIVYFAALFSYIILIILGIRGWMLPGAEKGIIYYLYPDSTKITKIIVWVDAASKQSLLLFFILSKS